MHKILVVDDHEHIISFVRPALEREGYVVLTANDGITALHVWRTERPALILLDIEIPDPNGLAVCREIRAADDRTPIVFMTVRNSISDLEFGFTMGADDYISKPFDVRELMARVKARLPRPLQEFGGYLQVDTLGHNVRRKVADNWEIVDLTPKEFDLLNYLVTNAGRPIGKTTLLAAVFDIPEDRTIETKTLEKHIWALRQKLEPDPKSPTVIVNVRGIGYKFAI